MKILSIILIVLFVSCTSSKVSKPLNEELAGIYVFQSDSKYKALSDINNYSSLEIHPNGTYIINKAAITFTPVIEQCDYASKGKWSFVADNVLEITSENNYTQQQGFEYEIKKGNRSDQDSLYIQIVITDDLPSVIFNFTFNHNNSKSYNTNKMHIVLPKSKYLWSKPKGENQINFSLNANVSGTTLYKSRVLFKIFEEYIDTEKYNHLTITLPHFDRCFFEFEPYNQELIYIKGKNELLWQGNIWKRK